MKTRKINFLITGANGFIGNNLSKELAKIPCANVTGSVRQLKTQYKSNINYVTIDDFSDEHTVAKALQGIDVLIHTAGRAHIFNTSSTSSLATFHEINVNSTLNLANQASIAGVSRFIFISSIGVNGFYTDSDSSFSEDTQPKPHNAYAISKWEAEQGLMNIAAETGLEVVIIRPPLVYGHKAPGNFGTLVKAITRGIPLPLKNINNQRSFIGLDNLIDFIITCTTHPNAVNQTFLVSDGEDISTPELIRGITNAAGVPARLFPMPTWALQMAGNLLGKGDAVQRLCGNLQVDISKARDLLGWTPPISVEESLKRAVGNVEK
jgi:nucleoside-diphosphate-sugar epimerase